MRKTKQLFVSLSLVSAILIAGDAGFALTPFCGTPAGGISVQQSNSDDPVSNDEVLTDQAKATIKAREDALNLAIAKAQESYEKELEDSRKTMESYKRASVVLASRPPQPEPKKGKIRPYTNFETLLGAKGEGKLVPYNNFQALTGAGARVYGTAEDAAVCDTFARAFEKKYKKLLAGHDAYIRSKTRVEAKALAVAKVRFGVSSGE